MLVNPRSSCRYGFRCPCCQAAPGKPRKVERRNIKRRERQAWKAEVNES